jgi:hypothetical protein
MMANRKRKRSAAGLAIFGPNGGRAPVNLSDADRAILGEVALNRRAIVKLGQLSLDHEKRLRGLEDAIDELAGEEEESVDVEAE